MKKIVIILMFLTTLPSCRLNPASGSINKEWETRESGGHSRSLREQGAERAIDRLEWKWQPLAGSPAPALVLEIERSHEDVFLSYRLCPSVFEGLASSQNTSEISNALRVEHCRSGEVHGERGRDSLVLRHLIIDVPKSRDLPLALTYKACREKKSSQGVPSCASSQTLLIKPFGNQTDQTEVNPRLRASLLRQEQLEQQRYQVARELKANAGKLVKNLETCKSPGVGVAYPRLSEKELADLKAIANMSVEEIALKRFSLRESLQVHEIVTRGNATATNSTSSPSGNQTGKKAKKSGPLNDNALVAYHGFLLLGAVFVNYDRLNTIIEWWSFLRNKRKVLDPNDPKKVLRFKKGKKGVFTLDGYKHLKFIEDPYTREMYLLKKSGSTDERPSFKSFEDNQKILSVVLPEGFSYEHGYLKKGNDLFFIDRDKSGHFVGANTNDAIQRKVFDTEGLPTDKVYITKNQRYDLPGLKQQKTNALKKINSLRRTYDPQRGGLLKESYGRAWRWLTLGTSITGLVISSASFAKEVQDHFKLTDASSQCKDLRFIASSFEDKFWKMIQINQSIIDERIHFATMEGVVDAFD